MAGMIALLPADPDALTVDGGDPATLMHVTLVFLGDTDAVDAWAGDSRRAALLAGVAGLAQSAGGPIDAAAVGHATFAPGDPDSQCAVHLIGDSDRLAPLQQLAASLAAGVLDDALPAQHAPWLPHCTAGFGEGMDAAALDYIGPVRLDRLVLAIGDDWQAFPLAAAEEHHHREPLAELATPPVVPELEDDTDDGEPTDDELAAMADAALHAVVDQRDRTHDQAAQRLAAVMVMFGQALSHDAVARAYDPGADRASNRAALAAALAVQAEQTGHADAWAKAAKDAHTAAVLAGAAAAAHVLSAGSVPVDPAESPFPDPFDPSEWVAEQTGGLAGDLLAVWDRIDLDAGWELGDLDDAGAIVGRGDGALYYQDVQVSDAYLDASAALYLAAGIPTYYWNTMSGACPTCVDLESNNPWSYIPGTPHGGCRCWVTPGAPG